MQRTQRTTRSFIKNAAFFYKERKRTQRTPRSFIKNVAFFWKERMPNQCSIIWYYIVIVNTAQYYMMFCSDEHFFVISLLFLKKSRKLFVKGNVFSLTFIKRLTDNKVSFYFLPQSLSLISTVFSWTKMLYCYKLHDTVTTRNMTNKFFQTSFSFSLDFYNNDKKITFFIALAIDSVTFLRVKKKTKMHSRSCM